MIAAGLLAKKAVEHGLSTQTVGENEPGARFESRHRISQGSRPAAVSRRTGIQSRRLWMHDLHRQQRAVARRCVGGSRREKPCRGVGVERQSKLRRANPAAGSRELPGVASARRRLRAGRRDDRRPDERAARRGTKRRAGVPQGHLAERSRNSGDDAPRRSRRHVPGAVRGRVQRRFAVAIARRSDRESI